jgi:hypothetical protein
MSQTAAEAWRSTFALLPNLVREPIETPSFSRRSKDAVFQVSEDACWNDERDCVEFSVILRPCEGTVWIAERKLRCRQRTEDGHVEISGRDLPEKTHPVGQGNLFGWAAAHPALEG